MYDCHIREMVEALAKAGLISKANLVKEQAFKELRNVWMDKMALVWTADDIRTASRNGKRKYNLNVNTIRAILDEVQHQHDANVGVTWDGLACLIDTYCRSKGIFPIKVEDATPDDETQE